MSIPSYWQPVVQSAFYGKYIRLRYTQKVQRRQDSDMENNYRQAGLLRYFLFIGKTADRMMIRAGGFGGGARTGGAPGQPEPVAREEMPTEFLPHPIKNFTTVYIMTEEVRRFLLIIQMLRTDGTNWALITSLPTLQKVVLSNLSAGRAVIGDAIKWVRQK